MIFKALRHSTIRGLGEMLLHRYASRTFASAAQDMPNLTVMENGDKAQFIFSKEEMDRRITNLRKHMADNSIEGVLFTSMHNINYFSGFLYCQFGRPFGLAVTMDKVTSLSPFVDGGRAWRRTANGGNLIFTDWKKDNFYRAVRYEFAGIKVKLGLEFDQIPVGSSQKLQLFNPDVELIDIASPCMQMRMVKSKEEIDIIKEGAKICEVGGAAVLEACEEGVREYEVAQHATNVLVREVAKRFPGIELQDTWAWFQTGINTDGAHNPPTSRQLQRGDIISMNVFPMICGYYTALERTLFMDHVTSDMHLQLWEINCEVHRKGLELVKPGVRCCDVVNELDAIYDAYGVRKYRTIGYGHSIGILSHYYGREADLEFRSDIETVLEPGMVVSMEPMLVIPEGTAGAGGYREHDMLVLTEKGNENLTEFPYGPEHNIIMK